MIEINGVVTPNAFQEFDELIKGRREVIFVRTNVRPLKVYEAWRSKEEGYGPSGTPKDLGKNISTNIPMEFISLEKFNGDKFTPQVKVRYYKTKTQVQVHNGTETIYDCGDGMPHFIFSGESIRLRVDTTEGRELFRVLMAHPGNSDYPEYGPRRTPLFKLVNIEEKAKQSNDRKRIIHQAVGLVYNEQEVPKSLAGKLHKYIAKEKPALGFTSTEELISLGDYETLRADLARYAEQNPSDFHSLVARANIGLRNEIKDAYELALIDHNEKRWVWGEKVKTNKRDICDIAIGEDPTDALIAFLIDDKKGKQTLERMTTELEKCREALKQLTAAQA